MLAESDMQSIFVGLRTPTSGGRVACRLPSAARCLFGTPGTAPRLLLAGLALALLSACQPEADTAPPQVRPVRTVTVVKRDVGEMVSFTGRIQAESCDDDTDHLAFCWTENISAPNLSYAAQYLAYALPYQRFACSLTTTRA
jgi:hypothetical protein